MLYLAFMIQIKKSVCIQYNTIVDGYPFKVNYLNVIEVNYLGEKL